MSKPTLRLHIAFDFELDAPEALLQLDQESLCRELTAQLGSMVMQGMPAITGKQLAKAGTQVLAHHHHLEVENLQAPRIPREQLIAAAPHLTDDELEQLGRRCAGKQAQQVDLARILRRSALSICNEFRLVDCVVEAIFMSGAPGSLEGRLNLTNGSIMIGEKDRMQRLQTQQPTVAVRVPGSAAVMQAEYSGHTLSGPVLSVAIDQLARYRDELIPLWAAQA